MLYGKKSLLPQKTPLKTEYIEVKINPGKITKKTFKQRLSANTNDKLFLKNTKNKQTGIAQARVSAKPEEIICCTFRWLFSALYLVINLETVTGVPEQQIVYTSPKTESAT